MAAMNNRQERAMYKGMRLLHSTAHSAAVMSGRIKDPGWMGGRNRLEDRPAIIETRGMRSGLSISMVPSRFSA